SAAEVLVQKNAGQHNGDGGIEGTEHDRVVQASNLTRANEDGSAGNVEDSGHYGNAQHRRGHRAQVPSEKNDSCRDQQRSKPRACGDPQRRSAARLVDAEVKASKADSGKHGHAQAFGTASASFSA